MGNGSKWTKYSKTQNRNYLWSKYPLKYDNRRPSLSPFRIPNVNIWAILAVLVAGFFLLNC